MNEALLELAHVTIIRGGRRALDGVSLAVPWGQHVAILGPNGAGKSTLLRMVNGEFHPLRRPGVRMRLLGRERWNVFEIRRQLGVVSHELQATHHGWLGLDLRAAFGLMERLRRLAAEGTTLVIVTHHVDQIPPEVERVVLLGAGRVFADGAKDEILTSRVLSELFEVGLQVVERNGYFQVLPG